MFCTNFCFDCVSGEVISCTKCRKMRGIQLHRLGSTLTITKVVIDMRQLGMPENKHK